jgi:hypothetical protein
MKYKNNVSILEFDLNSLQNTYSIYFFNFINLCKVTLFPFKFLK